MNILGMWDGHDSGAALFEDGELIAAINEERLTRRKLEVRFPTASIQECLNMAGIRADNIDHVACCTSDIAKTLARLAPSTKESYYQIRRREIPPTRSSRLKKKLKYWITERGSNFFTRKLSQSLIARQLTDIGLVAARIHIFDHHDCHAAAAGFGSGFESCVVVSIDGVGDGTSATVSTFDGKRLERIGTSHARNSLGVFFEHVTNLMNMRELEDEGKVMALADYTFATDIGQNPFNKLIWVDELKIVSRYSGSKMHARIRDIQWSCSNEQLAYFAQQTVEKIVCELVENAVRTTGLHRVALAGGVASNVKANRRVRLMQSVDEVFIFPHMGDGGLAVGAGILCALEADKTPKLDMTNLDLGPQFSNTEIERALECAGLKFDIPSDPCEELVSLLVENGVALWFQGRMEYGPRALGHRSVLARPDNPAIRDRINLSLKRRAWFQPFCPSMLESTARDVLDDLDGFPNRHMTMAYRVKDDFLASLAGVISNDGTCRPQIIRDSDNTLYTKLLKHMQQATGVGALLNTSFNIHGEPLVCTPEEAIDVFVRSKADAMLIGPCLVQKQGENP